MSTQSITELGQAARKASISLSSVSEAARNQALLAIGKSIRSQQEHIMEANRQDVAEALQAGLSKPLIDRLTITPEKCTQMVSSLSALAMLPDPLGKIQYAKELANGLRLYQVTCPIGVIGVIFESRPDALLQQAQSLRTLESVGHHDRTQCRIQGEIRRFDHEFDEDRGFAVCKGHAGAAFFHRGPDQIGRRCRALPNGARLARMLGNVRILAKGAGEITAFRAERKSAGARQIMVERLFLYRIDMSAGNTVAHQGTQAAAIVPAHAAQAMGADRQTAGVYAGKTLRLAVGQRFPEQGVHGLPLIYTVAGLVASLE